MSGSLVARSVGFPSAVEPSIAGLPSKGSRKHKALSGKRLWFRGGEVVGGVRSSTPEGAEAQLRVSVGMISNESRLR